MFTNYKIVKQAISAELAGFVYQYFLNKRKVVKHLFDTKYISPYSEDWGTWSINTNQVPETYSHYGDIAMDTLLQRVKPIVEKETGLQLVETYSYARIYKKGDILPRHKDRPSCETSCTMNLGGDIWPIFLDPLGKGDMIKENDVVVDYSPGSEKGVSIELEPSDMLIYRGCDLEHWREAFEGEDCAQVFLHYNDINGDFLEKNKYDGRPFLGLPTWFR
tara:strand:- start:52 stop:708 length:657 start_codon:yes stop_codon:yes gene_type:complete